MGIVVTCPGCQKKLRVPEKAAGKRVRCPQCQGIISVPAAEGGGEEPTVSGSAPTVTPSKGSGGGSSAAGGSGGQGKAGSQAKFSPTGSGAAGGSGKSSPAGPAESWHVQTEDGATYGPVTRAELDTWYQEGRITADTQLLREGADQWQWATDIFPELEQGTGQAAGDNPFAFVGSEAGGSAPSGGGPVFSAGGGGSAGKSHSGEVGPKSKIVAGLLALFLGGYGVHRFYLGYTGMGLLMLFTCGGCGIWALIEAIMIFTGSFNRDAQGRLLKD